jgi:SAM-dependent methyltransferase
MNGMKLRRLFRGKKYVVESGDVLSEALCPLCGVPLEVTENGLGVHCEGLQCKNCGVNARNRFFYSVLNRVIKEQLRGQDGPRLDVLEASSFGYASLSERYLKSMEEKGARLICSDYFENSFKAVVKEDLAALSFKDESLDIVCHSHVLEHVEDDREAIKESCRCLRVGGKLLVAVPIQTDETYAPENEYHGDNAYVFRRNGWDIIDKLKDGGFHVEVRVPPEHAVFDSAAVKSGRQLVLDAVTYEEKFGRNFELNRPLFYSAIDAKVSALNRFGGIWGQLEVFVATKPAA